MKTTDRVEQAMNHVWADFEAYVRMLAKEHTIANMGQDLAALGAHAASSETYVAAAYSQLLTDCESDEMADGIEEEYREWLKQARSDAEAVRGANLPLTLANARLAFEKKGPFARGVTYRVEFTVERRGKATRKSLEGKDLQKLLKRVEKLDGYQVVTSSEVPS